MAAGAAGSAGETLVQETLRLVDQGLKEFNQANTGEMNGRSVILVGNTGVGKSTLINLLAGVQLKAVYDDDAGQSRIDADHPLPNFKIGHKTHSETSIPRKVTIETVMYWDNPGLNDNRGIAQEIANAACIREVFRVSREVKIMLVTSESELVNPRALPLTDFVSALTQLFPGQENKIKRSIFTVVTGASPNKEPRHIGAVIQRAITDLQLPEGPERVLMESLVSQPISLFRRPELRSYELDTGALKGALLTDMERVTYASEVVAHVSISPRCHVTLNESYNELHTIVSGLVSNFATQFSSCVETFVAPYSDQKTTLDATQRQAATKTLESLVPKLSALLEENAYSVQTIPEMVRAYQEIAAECKGTLEANLQTIQEKVKAVRVLEEYITEVTHLPLDVVRTMREAASSARVKVEKALIHLKAKDAEEKAALEKKRADGEQQKANQERARAEAANKELQALKKRNRERQERDRIRRQSNSCGKGRRQGGGCAVQ